MSGKRQEPEGVPPPRWVLDMRSEHSPKAKSNNIPDPPGFSQNAGGKRSNTAKQPTPHKESTTEGMDTLKLKKAWELAIAPAKSLPMNAIGMYMTGNSLQIFSIMMVFMLFKTPIQALLNINNTFARFETEGTQQRLMVAKLAFVATNLMALALGIWKVNAMGLLPTTRSDWLAWEVQREPLERATPAFSL